MELFRLQCNNLDSVLFNLDYHSEIPETSYLKQQSRISVIRKSKNKVPEWLVLVSAASAFGSAWLTDSLLVRTLIPSWSSHTHEARSSNTTTLEIKLTNFGDKGQSSQSRKLTFAIFVSFGVLVLVEFWIPTQICVTDNSPSQIGDTVVPLMSCSMQRWISFSHEPKACSF